MRKVKIILIIACFILTGCSTEYNLEFSNDKIKEHIVANILDTDIPKQIDNPISELDDQITPFIKNEQYPFPNNTDDKYTKKITNKSNYTEVTLDYSYSHEEFKNSKAYGTCFEEKSFEENKKGYSLNFSGSFYCLYGDSVTINIKTNNEVISHNADKVSGNTYTWVINKDNAQDTNISINISKTSMYVKPIIYIIIGVVFLVLSIGAYIAYNKIKNRDSINEI